MQGGTVTSLKCEVDGGCPPEGRPQRVPGEERPGHVGETIFLPVAAIWAHRHLDSRPNTGDHYLFNWKKTQGSFACLCGSCSLLEFRQRVGEMLHALSSPETRSRRMLFSGPACFWLVWQALVSYQMWKFFSAWDNLFICLCILPGKYLLSSWYSFARNSWGSSSSV